MGQRAAAAAAAAAAACCCLRLPPLRNVSLVPGVCCQGCLIQHHHQGVLPLILQQLGVWQGEDVLCLLANGAASCSCCQGCARGQAAKPRRASTAAAATTTATAAASTAAAAAASAAAALLPAPPAHAAGEGQQGAGWHLSPLQGQEATGGQGGQALGGHNGADGALPHSLAAGSAALAGQGLGSKPVTQVRQGVLLHLLQALAQVYLCIVQVVLQSLLAQHLMQLLHSAGTSHGWGRVHKGGGRASQASKRNGWGGCS